MPAVAEAPLVETRLVRVTSPFPGHAVPRIWHWTQEFHKAVADDFSPQTLDEFAAYWEAKERIQASWGVWRGEELGGAITLVSLNPVVGVLRSVFKKGFWGEETIIPALSAACIDVFKAGLDKIALFPFEHNTAMIRMLKTLGAVKEGTLQADSRQHGKPVDTVIMALFREDFERCQKGKA